MTLINVLRYDTIEEFNVLNVNLDLLGRTWLLIVLIYALVQYASTRHIQHISNRHPEVCSIAGITLQGHLGSLEIRPIWFDRWHAIYIDV